MSIFFPIRVWQRVRCLLHVPIFFLMFKSLKKFLNSIAHYTKQTLFKFPSPDDLVYFVSDKSICKIDKLLKTLAINVLYDSNFFDHFIFFVIFIIETFLYKKNPTYMFFILIQNRYINPTDTNITNSISNKSLYIPKTRMKTDCRLCCLTSDNVTGIYIVSFNEESI